MKYLHISGLNFHEATENLYFTVLLDFLIIDEFLHSRPPFA